MKHHKRGSAKESKTISKKIFKKYFMHWNLLTAQEAISQFLKKK